MGKRGVQNFNNLEYTERNSEYFPIGAQREDIDSKLVVPKYQEHGVNASN